MSDHAPPSPGEVRALANQLLAWADRLAEHRAADRDPARLAEDELVLAMALAAREIGRRRHDVFAGADLGNPTWDVLLDLYVRESQGFHVSLDRLALSGELRADTVYASVDALVAAGLAERASDRFDARVTWLSVSETGRARMAEFLLESARYVSPRGGADGELATA